jgi:hypothetical protein
MVKRILSNELFGEIDYGKVFKNEWRTWKKI